MGRGGPDERTRRKLYDSTVGKPTEFIVARVQMDFRRSHFAHKQTNKIDRTDDRTDNTLQHVTQQHFYEYVCLV